MNKKFWFASKTYGWGWTPSSWQGWIILLMFIFYEVAIASLIGKSFDSRAGITTFLFLTTIGVSVLISICYRFGEVPTWRWGNKTQPKRSR